ncbi:MAG: hypothetical protein QNJ55_25405 [Xenococcus sp. MO_188.B8]|nr:hypothetical protein [Xenococcus sp. MO_188.B8]
MKTKSVETQDMVTQELSHYDPHIVPPELKARAAREGKNFGHVEHDIPGDTEHLHNRDGYTVDEEGLINNYAVEPEMYIKVPGDLKAKQKQLRMQRLHELQELSEGEEGKLTMEHDWRHKGPGMI